MANKKLSLEDIESIPGAFVTLKEAADFLGTTEQSLRQQAQRDPLMLGFPVIVVLSRTIIPKSGFVSYMKYGRLVTSNWEAI